MKSIAVRAHEAAAYAAGRLTQIRRVVKPQPFLAPYRGGMPMLQLQHKKFMMIRGQAVSHYVTNSADDMTEVLRGFPCPYGAPGDRLALREGWKPDVQDDISGIRYKSDETFIEHENSADAAQAWLDCRRPEEQWPTLAPVVWRSPATMPLWAVRWHPVITAVRLERVQEMTEGDAVACGIQSTPLAWHYMHQFDRDNPRTPWESNPWVWVIDVEGNTK